MNFTFWGLLVTLGVFFNFIELSLSQHEDPHEQIRAAERGGLRRDHHHLVRSPHPITVPNRPAGTQVPLPNGASYTSLGTGPMVIFMDRTSGDCLVVQNNDYMHATEVYPPNRARPNYTPRGHPD